MLHVFDCHRCGACCKLVNLSNQTSELDRGDGICRHFDELGNACNIYESRPEICNVSVMYEKSYKNIYDWASFSAINKEVCSYLENLVETKTSLPHAKK